MLRRYFVLFTLMPPIIDARFDCIYFRRRFSPLPPFSCLSLMSAIDDDMAAL